MLEYKSIRQIHEAYDGKKLSPVELTQMFLERIRASDHNAYLEVCEDRAISQAKEAEALLGREGKVPREKYPLLGIPLGIKDVLCLEGVRTTAGSKMLDNYRPPYTATAVKRLENAGAITLGKLNCDEFAMGSSNENSAYGNVKHPTHPGHVPGGSSGGSGTAVGAGLAVATLGTDTGGSIRLPASFCGVVGVKPTYGRISRYGQIAFASSLDQIGPMSSNVEDSARLLSVMAGPDSMDSTSAPVEKVDWLQSTSRDTDWKGLRIGMPAEYFEVEGVDPSVKACIENAVKLAESKGAKLVPLKLPHTPYAVAVYYLVAVSEASSNLARYDGVRFGVRPKGAFESGNLVQFYEKVRACFGEEVKRRIILGTFALSSGYYDAYYRRASQVRRLIRNDFEEAFKKVDVIVGPVAPTTAFQEGAKVQDPLQMYLNDIFTIPASLAGLPALSLPVGSDAKGLPVGLHMIGAHFNEELLLNCAAGLERELERV